MTIDSDIADRLKELMHTKKIGFQQAINDTLRKGLPGGQRKRRYRLRTVPMQIKPSVSITLHLADELEDAELLRTMELRK